MKRFCLAVSLWFIALWAQAAVVVQDVRANRLPDKVQVVLDLDNATVFQQFSLPDPPRIVLDIPNAQRPGRAGFTLNNGPVNSVRTGFRTQDMLRVVIDLNDVVKANIYTLTPEGNRGHRIVVDVYDRTYDPALTLSSLDDAQTPFVVFAGGPLATRQQLNTLVEEQPPVRVASAPPPVQTPAGRVNVAAPPPIQTSPPAQPIAAAPPVNIASPDIVQVGGSGRTAALIVQGAPIASTPATPRTPTPTPTPSTPALQITPASPPPTPTTAVAVSRNISSSGQVQTQTAVRQPVRKKDIVVVIDPGHGGKDPGAVSRATGLQEKGVVLAISQRLKRILDGKAGYRAVLTRDRDVFIPLRERTAIARRHQADLFISIHADAVESEGPRGSSVYILSTRGASSQLARYLANSENAVDLKWGVDVSKYDNEIQEALLDIQLDATLESSNVFGRHTIRELGKLGRTHKSNVERANFVVLRSPEIPSLLVETAFISNPEDAKLLASPAYQDQLARGIANGIDSYFREHLPQHMLLAQ